MAGFFIGIFRMLAYHTAGMTKKPGLCPPAGIRIVMDINHYILKT